jgi:KDO2-lipid IV(A) lauroyltransferase
METTVYHIISFLFSLLGRIRREKAKKTAGFVGRIWFAVDKRHRDAAMENLTHVFGAEKNAEQIRGLAHRVFCNLVFMIFEIGWMLHLKEKDIPKYFRTRGLYHLQAAHKKGRGVLILTGHVGSWELMAMCVAMVGYPISAIYRPLDFKPLDLFFKDIRSRFGAKLYAKKYAMRPILRGLKRGELIGVLLDQNTNIQAGVFVDFFKKPACTNEGLALIALHTKAPVVPVFLVRESDGYLVEIGPEIPMVQTGHREADVAANTRLYNQVLEDVILRYPDQWFWVHRRWKTRPIRPAS